MVKPLVPPMVDILGPYVSTPQHVLSRPGKVGDAAGAGFTWIKDCTDDNAEDGTPITAEHLNNYKAQFLTAFQESGISIDDVDAMLAYTIQSGGLNWAVATGTANAWVVAPALAVPAYKTGRVLWIKPPAVNTSTTVNANVSTLGNRRVKKADGTDPVPGDLTSRWYPFLDDGTNLCAIAFLPSDLAANKSPFNVTRTVYTARVSLSGTGLVTYQTGTYTKKSATSQLVVECSTNLFATSTAAGLARVSGLPTNLEFTCKNADGGTSSAACTGSKIYAGLAAGVVNWTWSFGRGDALAWTSIINPRTADASYMPAETTSFIQFSELEP